MEDHGKDWLPYKLKSSIIILQQFNDEICVHVYDGGEISTTFSYTYGVNRNEIKTSVMLSK